MNSPLKEQIRKKAQEFRENRRENEFDGKRMALGEVQNQILEPLTEKDVVSLAARIKRRKGTTLEDLFRLNQAFLQGTEFINSFVNITGALQVLVKELTGRDSSHQIAACETFCNLSLGDPPICSKIASCVGTYLVTYLDASQENRLKITSLWTITNLLEAPKSREILLSMEIIPKLITIYFNELENPEIRECAGEALSILSSYNTFKEKDLLLLTEKRMKTTNNPGSQFYLKIIFESGILKQNIEIDFVEYLLKFSIESLKSDIFIKQCYSLRVMGNLFALGCRKDFDLLEILRDCELNECLKDEVLWVIKNFYS